MKKLILLFSAVCALSASAFATKIDIPGAADVNINYETGLGSVSCTSVGYCGTIYSDIGLGRLKMYVNGYGTFILDKATNSDDEEVDNFDEYEGSLSNMTFELGGYTEE